MTQTLENKSIRANRMSLINQILLIFLGSVFIFSGLIKLNDPVGTKIKLEEYFEVFAQDLPWAAGFFESLVPVALVFSVILCVLEVVLGIAVLIRYRMKLTMWVLLGIIVFFTFLTFYSAYFNKVTDCGCFGDAIKLKPWQSFGKDILLLSIILFLLPQRKKLYPVLSSKSGDLLAGISTLLCLGLGLYAIFFLPPIDFLPYKVGKNIPAQMTLPPDAKPTLYDMTFVMKNLKSGETKDMTLDEYNKSWEDTLTWKYVSNSQKLIQEGDKPKIMGFVITDGERLEITEQLFKGNKLLIIVQNFQQAGEGNLKKIQEFIKQTRQLKSVEIVIITSSDEVTTETFRHEYQLGVPCYFADAVILKTMIRTNPGLILLKNGTVRQKWSYLQIPNIKEMEENL
jgi:uncharacterized membrane protein YphA (DoxX/SURF4 family)